ncbi:MAG: DUF4367 domain-containing protein [Oscillospiraceae bacterium]|nr:DUF4367 domain-containing protein [Oscillospiraceae bacterium]
MTAETLRSAMRCSACEEFSFVPKEENIDWNFSKSFLMRMDSVIGREYHSFRRSTATVKRILLIAVLAATLLLSLLSVSAFREPVIRFFAEMFGDHMDLSFGVEKPGDTQIPQDEFVVYQPEYIPEDFAATSFFADRVSSRTIWTSNRNDTIVLDQYQGLSDISMDTEQGQIIKENINGAEVLIHQMSNQYVAIWNSGQYTFELAVYADVPFEIVIQIISSISSQQKDK